MICRSCGSARLSPFIDLGVAPPSNALLSFEDLEQVEQKYPLRVHTCESCWLVQTEDFLRPETLFHPSYHYSSSASQSWLSHSANFVESTIRTLGLGAESMVVEIAANDGYLLQFVRDAKIPCYGIEPTHRVAEIARSKGLTILESFFGQELARDLQRAGKQADLIVANNVLAHVPDINDFVRGVELLLKPKGVVSFEFPHLVQLVRGAQFDTIYHEHYSYLSFASLEYILRAHGLLAFDVDLLPTHGGSLRVWARRAENAGRVSSSIAELQRLEESIGVRSAGFYGELQSQAEIVKQDLLKFLNAKRDKHEKVVGYGAAAKGNTLLNYANIDISLMPYIADRDQAKQGMFTPGAHIPIVPPEHIFSDRPYWILILPWNLKEEIVSQLEKVRESGVKFVTAVPTLNEF